MVMNVRDKLQGRTIPEQEGRGTMMKTTVAKVGLLLKFIRLSSHGLVSAVLVLISMLTVIVAISGKQITFIPNGTFFANPGGASETYATGGGIDLTGPFFQSLGTNSRSCGTCHQPSDGMSVSA